MKQLVWKRPLPEPPRIPGEPAMCLVGEGARFVLGHRRPRRLPEILVEGTLETICAGAGIVPDPDLPGTAVGQGWRIWPANGGLRAGLEDRLIPADAVGITPAGEVLDPLDGMSALSKGQLGVDDPQALASAHPEALVSMLAVCANLNLTPFKGLTDAMNAIPEVALRVEANRLRHDLTGVLVGRSVGPVLEAMSRTSLMGFVLPEVASLRNFHRSSRFHHKDVWAHTRQVVEQAVPRPLIRWAALLHDIGKVHTRGYGPGKKVSFLRHDELGAYMFDGIAHRLSFPTAMAERMRVLILYHLRPGAFDAGWGDSAVRRFSAEVGPAMHDLLLLSRADVTSKRPGRRREVMFHLHNLQLRIADVARRDAERAHSIPKGLGTAIIKDLGVSPGPRIGELRRVCEAAVRRGELPSDAEIPAYIDYLRGQGLG
ncbi:MAG: HDIG domain-containing metalloprotein [Bradymonadia bacterium]